VQHVFLMTGDVPNTVRLSESVALNRRSPLAAHLASDAAPCVTGSTFFIDFGMLRNAGSL
jgi:enoyl-[acyl-carrier-protein] reductase (NADH)